MYSNRLLCLVLSLLLFSCSKDELTRPVQTSLVVEMVSPEAEQPDDLLKVTDARLLIKTFGFEGYREHGENYFFTREFKDSLKVNFSTKAAGHITSFEMPQGVYTKIGISLTVPAGKDAQSASEIQHRSSFTGGVEIWGTYQNTHDKEIPFLFVYTALDEFKFTAQSSITGTQEVVVKDKANYQARLQFDPQQWMSLINARMLQSAKISQLDGVPTIIISRSQNEHIYNLLVNRIEKSTSLNIE